MVRIAILITLFATGVGCNGQPAERLLAIAQSFCTDAEILEIDRKENFTELEFSCAGKVYEIGVSEKYEVLYVETEAEIPAEVMTKIRNRLEKQYPGWFIDEMDLIEMKDTSFYKIEVMKGGVEENLYFTRHGKVFRLHTAAPDDSELVRELKQSDVYQSAPYNFLNPTRVYDLPDILVEISGIAIGDDKTVYCVQDELGLVFIFELESGEVAETIRFTDVGDFEDIQVRNNIVYILRSDGTLFYFDLGQRNEIKQVMLPLQCLNAEGLFFGGENEVWFVACKEDMLTGSKNERLIYHFEHNQWAKAQSTFSVNMRDIEKELKQSYPKVKWGEVAFNPSAVAVHPHTGELYVLSAKQEYLAVYKGDKLKAVYPLPAEMYYKPEGIDFTASGDLLLSSEGRKKGYLNGQIYYFRKK